MHGARTSTEVDLAPLFSPRSIAIVGATPDIGKPGGRCLDFLVRFGFPGAVYPINPRYPQIAGLNAYPDLAAIPEPVDLVLIVIAAHQVPDALEAAAKAGARAAIVFSSGFREVGESGAVLERQLTEIASRHGLAVLGPNCLGYVDVGARLPATFSTALQAGVEPVPGRIAFISQSGAMGAAIFGVAQAAGIGVSVFASTGNESSLLYRDVLRHFGADDRLSVLLGYVEGVSDGRDFIDAVRFAREHGKSVVLLKVGRSDAGKLAAQSHTGAMAGNEEAWDAALRRAGAIRASSPSNLLDIAMVLEGSPRPAGNRLGIVSMSGGAGVLMADRASELGLAIPVLSAHTQDLLSTVLPAGCSLTNPVDFGAAYGTPAAIEQTVRIVAESDDVDIALLFLGLSPNLGGDIEARLAEVAQSTAKPLIVVWLGGPQDAVRDLRRRGIPTYGDPITATEMAAILWRSTQALPADSRPDPSQTTLRTQLTELKENGRTALSESETKMLLAQYGLPIARELVARTAQEAVDHAGQLGGRLAVKVDAPELAHKSDIGGVVLNVGADDVSAAFDQVVGAARTAGVEPRGAVIAQMAPPDGIELLIGARWDEQFGPLIVVGAGGTTSEVAHDTAVDLAPIDADRAAQMINSLRIAPLLHGFRGEPKRDLRAAAQAVAALSRFAADAGSVLREIDINPLTVYAQGDGCLVLDATSNLG
jgi:acyl-CoA synthetase (NDP forming)